MSRALCWRAGNEVELLENGEAYYPRVFAAIDAAQVQVHVQTYILADDVVGRRLRDHLLAAARRGVSVDLLIDDYGSAELGPAFRQGLVDAGVNLHVYDPAPRLLGWCFGIFRRLHRKIVVIDGRQAFVGGLNFCRTHLQDCGAEAKQDFAVALQGPIVADVHDLARCTLRPLPVVQRWRRMFARRRVAAAVAQAEAGRAALVVRDNHAHPRDIERQYRIALRTARHRVLIANAYFFPGHGLMRDLRRAARRGVDVRLILQGRPDVPVVGWAAQLLYAPLQRAGVRIYEYTRCALHGKVAVVDDDWATVGSSNLDPTSLALNLECNVIVRDAGFNRTLSQRLHQLMDAHCREMPAARPSRWSSAVAQVQHGAASWVMRRFPMWLTRIPAAWPRVQRLAAQARRLVLS